MIRNRKAWGGVAAAWAALSGPPAAWAVAIDMDNPDVALRWDNTLKYSAAVRLRDADPVLLANPNNDDVECLSFADLYALIGPESNGFADWSDAQDLATELGSSTELPDATLDLTGPGTESGTYEIDRVRWNTESDRVEPPVRAALERAAARIRAFHERQVEPDVEHVDGGIRLALVTRPLARVGIYVPGGTARYPSSVLMTAIPARVAGVEEIVMVTPGPSPETLLAAKIARK